jgi:hypothetical protein
MVMVPSGLVQLTVPAETEAGKASSMIASKARPVKDTTFKRDIGRIFFSPKLVFGTSTMLS